MTDGVLAVLGDGFKKMRVLDNGERIMLGPAIIVAQANRALKPFNRKLGPDPASQATCKIGGVVNNNSSGMCCGVAYNTYHTLQRLRVMLVDGTVLDSGDPDVGRGVPQEPRGRCSRRCTQLHHEVMANAELVALIRQEVPDQEHGRLFDQCAGRFPRPDRHPRPPDRRLGGDARLRLRGDLPHHPRASVQG